MKLIVFCVVIFTLVIERANAAPITFVHSFGRYLEYPSSSIWQKVSLVGSKEATLASASLICKSRLQNSYAREVSGQHIDVDETHFKYTGRYECHEMDSAKIAVTLSVIQLNKINCMWRGPSYSDSFLAAVCERDYGKKTGEKLWGGCVAGENENVYLFQGYCE